MVTRLREEAPDIEKALFEQIGAPEREWLSKHGGDIEEIPKVISAVLEHCFSAIDGDQDRPPPPEAITHARALARIGCGTDTLLERYIGCKVVFMEHLRQANLSVKPRSDAGFTKAQRRTEDFLLRLLKLVCKEHRAELKRRGRPRKDRELERVEQFLSGKLAYPPEDLGYDFSATHIGVVGSGPGVDDEIRRLAKLLGGQTLILQAYPDRFWAWIGLKRQSSAAGLDKALKEEWSPRVRMGIGEPADGLAGWRCTHHQAKAVLPVAIHRSDSVVRYAEVAVIASIAGDALLVEFLLERYVTPLAADGPDRLRLFHATLSAYFVTNGNRSAAASALGMSRQALAGRLRTIEKRIGQPMEVCGPVLCLALELPQFQDAYIAGN